MSAIGRVGWFVPQILPIADSVKQPNLAGINCCALVPWFRQGVPSKSRALSVSLLARPAVLHSEPSRLVPFLLKVAEDFQQLVLYCEEIGLSSAFTHDDWEIYPGT